MPFRAVLLAIAMVAILPVCARAAEGHRGNVDSVAFSPDGHTALSGSNDQTMILWDLAHRRVIRTFTGHTGAVSAVAFSADGRSAISGSDDGSVRIWDLANGQVVRTIGIDSGVTAIAVAPGGHGLLLGLSRGPPRLYDLTNGQQIRAFEGIDQGTRSVALAADGRTALSGNADKNATLWDVATGRPVRTFDGQSNEVTAVAFTPDGHAALVGRLLYEVTTGALLRAFGDQYQGVYAATLSRDGRFALTSDFDKLKLWDVATGNPAQTFSGQHRNITSLALAPDGSMALTGGTDQALKLWDVASGRIAATIESAEAIEGRHLGTTLLGIPAAICWLSGFWLWRSYRNGFAAAQRTKTWANVDGSIVSSDVDTSGKALVGLALLFDILAIFSRAAPASAATINFVPKVRYSYLVAGQTYLGERIRFLPQSFKLRGNAEDAIKPYPAGGTATVYYDPRDPAQSVLDISEAGGRPLNHIVMLALAAALTAIAAYAYFAI